MERKLAEIFVESQDQSIFCLRALKDDGIGKTTKAFLCSEHIVTSLVQEPHQRIWEVLVG